VTELDDPSTLSGSFLSDRDSYGAPDHAFLTLHCLRSPAQTSVRSCYAG